MRSKFSFDKHFIIFEKMFTFDCAQMNSMGRYNGLIKLGLFEIICY